MQEALGFLDREHIHIAIIDIRLEDDGDPKDTSGLELAKLIQPPVAKIILTGYPSPEAVRESWKEAGAIDFVAKREGPEALLEAIGRAFRDKLGIRENLEIEWDEEGLTPLQIAEEVELIGIEPQQYEEEIVEVLLKLFSSAEADRVIVSHLMTPQRARVSSQSGAVLLKATPYYGHSRRATKVVKLAERGKIEVEVENYNRWVQPYIERHRYASQEGSPQYTLRVGGVIYTLFGADLEKVQDLSTFYERHQPSEIIGLLDSLFSETCKLWYGDRKRKSKQDIPELYSNMLHLSLKKLETALRKGPKLARYRPDAVTFKFPGITRSFINPLHWLEKHFYVDTEFCVTHGDMHSRNILIDDSGQAWLIDFARTGRGHVLRDFIELESDIKFALVAEADMMALCDFELALLSTDRLSDDTSYGDQFDLKPLNKAFTVLCDLRKLASRFSPTADIREYHQALLHQTLNVVRLKHIGPLKKQHALLAAALICERLQNWNAPWPPEDLEREIAAHVREEEGGPSPSPWPLVARIGALAGILLVSLAGVFTILKLVSLPTPQALLAIGVFIILIMFIIALIDKKMRRWIVERIIELYRGIQGTR